MIFKYLQQLIRHKWFVFLEACRLGIPWLGIIHDMSKFLPSEFIAYARNFYGDFPSVREVFKQCPSYTGPTKSSVKRDFDAAWNHHQKRNKHHWQYWVLMNDNSAEFWNVHDGIISSYDGTITLSCESIIGETADNIELFYRICNLLNKPEPLPMPERYVKEMIADWRGAGRAYGESDTVKWYLENRHNQIMHAATRYRVEVILGIENAMDRIANGNR